MRSESTMTTALNVALVTLLLGVPAYHSASVSRDPDEPEVVNSKHARLTNEADEQIQRWLDDYDAAPHDDEVDNAYETMQADSPFIDDEKPTGGVKTGNGNHRLFSSIATPAINRKLSQADYDHKDDEALRCPPPILPEALIRSWCSAANGSSGAMTSHQCGTDADCPSTNRKRKCCNNGCRRVCAVAIDPAPYIDWKREPQTRLTSGKSWLIQGPDEPQEVEWCSTSYVYDDVTVDEEPLLCPHGFVCFIDDPGDVENGVPNRGRCIPEKFSTSDKTGGEFKLATTYQAVNGTCVVNGVSHRNGDTFVYEKHTCKCEDGSVMCRVGKKIPLRRTSNNR